MRKIVVAAATITQHTTGYQWPSMQFPARHDRVDTWPASHRLCFTDKGDVVNDNPYWFRISKTATPDGNTAFVPREAISLSNNVVENCRPNGN